MAFLTDLKDGMDNDVLQPQRARGRFLCSRSGNLNCDVSRVIS